MEAQQTTDSDNAKSFVAFPQYPALVVVFLTLRFHELSRNCITVHSSCQAFATAEDIHMLMSKKKPRPFMLAQYYDSLQKIFWKSENYLFHAFAMLKYYLLSPFLSRALEVPESGPVSLYSNFYPFCSQFSSWLGPPPVQGCVVVVSWFSSFSYVAHAVETRP